MSVEFLRPQRLWLLPVCLGLVFLLAWRLKNGTRSGKVSLLLRQIMIVLTVCALAGMSVLTASPDRAAWLLVDVSASLQQEQAVSQARAALAAEGENRRVGVITFGRNATVERSIGQSGELTSPSGLVDRGGSDLGSALRLASALLPREANGGIAVISDGLVTLDQSDLQAVAGLPVNTLKLEARSGLDAQVTEVSVPATLYTGQKYTTRVTVHANASGEATLILSQNHEAVETRRVTLRKGENTFAFDSVAVGTGVSTCEARVLLDGDTLAANDQNAAFTVVSGDVSVLLAEGQSGAGGELAKMLRAAGMRVKTVAAGMLPEQAAELWAYQAVALVNVDAEQLTEGQLSALDGAARELGCGVAVFGGDSSYALGGYRGSALEKMLPVTIDVRNHLDLPTTALVLVIDKSGSMTEAAWGITRLALAREAACAALEVLTERDQAGVIAFDDTGKWVVPLSTVTDVAAMQQQVGTIRPGGGTAFYTPLTMAFQALKGVQAQYKHVIFLTDGEAGDTGYQEVVRQMAQEGITLTTVAVGDGADDAGLKRLADLGGGRMYAAGPFDSLPKIFTKETMLISGAYVQNRTFVPVVADASMTDFPGFPVLTGYLATTEKPLATVSLCSDREDPVLAWWQYGAGRVLAWTSDVQGGWSEAFLAWDQAAAFFGGLISFILPARAAEGEITLAEGRLTWRAEVPEQATSAVATLVNPDGTRQTVTLERLSADTFAGDVDTAQTGAYALRLSAVDRRGNTLTEAESGGVISWTGEADLRQRDEGALERLSEATGGKTCADAENLLSFPDTAARKRRDLTAPLLLLAAVLFLFDVAQRRLGWLRQPETKKASPANPREKPVKQTPKNPKKQEKRQEAPQGETAELLWQNLQKKKRL